MPINFNKFVVKNVFMTATEALREKVKQYIDVADTKSLKKVQSILEEDAGSDWWDELPQNVQTMIEHAIKEGEAGKVVPHEAVMEKFGKWFKK